MRGELVATWLRNVWYGYATTIQNGDVPIRLGSVYQGGQEGTLTPQTQRVVVLLLVIIFAVAPSVILLPSLRESYLAGCSVTLLLGSLWLWWSAGALLWRRRRAGALLLDLGPQRAERMVDVAGAALSLAILVWSLFASDLQAPLLIAGYVAFGAYMLLQSLLPLVSRVQLREAGIFLPSQYIPWQRIGSYDLRYVVDHGEIAIHYRTWGVSAGYPLELSIRCPDELRETAVHVLGQRIPFRSGRRPMR